MKAALIIVLLTGCAQLPPGVSMSDGDRAACESSRDCTVWTLGELRKLIAAAIQRGFTAGQKRKGELSL